ncbi:MAG TPA: hypothetical protein VFK70_09620 [Vicinamibacteria bacterium]|nr:hypothetical protein [Vicinamibacteria bacterium]
MHRTAVGGTSALLAAVLVGCGGASHTAPTPATDAISLRSITPAPGTPLTAGQRVDFTATVNYTLASAASGQIVIVIQDQLDQNLKPAGVIQTAVPVVMGTSTATLSDSITIPGTGVSSVRVVFPLIPTGATRTEVLVSVTYPVS